MVNRKYKSQEFLYVLLFHIVAPSCAILTNTCLTFWKLYVKDKNNNAKNSSTFCHYITNVPIDYNEIMVWFDVTSFYTNIPIIGTLNIIKDYVNNNDQFTRKTAIPQDKYLVLTTRGTLLMQFYQQTDGVAMGGPASSNSQQKFICRLINVLQYLQNCTLQKFGNGSWIMFTYTLGKILHRINNLHQNIKFTLEHEGNGEQAFLGTLLKQNNRKISVVVYRKPTHIDQYLQYSSHH